MTCRDKTQYIDKLITRYGMPMRRWDSFLNITPTGYRKRGNLLERRGALLETCSQLGRRECHPWEEEVGANAKRTRTCKHVNEQFQAWMLSWLTWLPVIPVPTVT